MKKLIIIILALTIVIINGFRFYDLANVPNGYHVDEYSAAVTARCFAKEGINAWGKKNFVFFNVAYGSPRPATYIWPVALIGKLLDNYRIPMIRAFSAALMTFGVLGVLALGWRLGGIFTGLFAALAASLSPPVFVMSRVAFESMSAAAFFAWALFFLFRTADKRSMAAAGFFMALSLYAYPPSRLFLPLFMVLFFLVMRGWRAGYGPWLAFAGALVLLCLPLIHETFTNFQVKRRFGEISIFAAIDAPALSWEWIKGSLMLFLRNLGLHLSPRFLFVSGDGSPVHSTRAHGLFSWLDYWAWAAGAGAFMWQKTKGGGCDLFKGDGRVIFLCVAGFFLALVPSALTNQEIPNALRISLYWPLTSLLAGVLIAHSRKIWPYSSMLAIVVAVLFAWQFLTYYFTEYRRVSWGMFDGWILRDARAVKSQRDRVHFIIKYRFKDYHTRYFMMNEQDRPCMDSFERWNNVYNNLGRGKRY